MNTLAKNPTKTSVMNFLCRSHSSHTRRRNHHLQIRTLYDAVSTLNIPRDRGLDHAVEREKHLQPLLNLKNLVLSEPSKSIPLSLITQSSETLGIPFRPIEFVRKYPSVFQEFHPAALNIQPHIKLTPEIFDLDSEENLVYRSVTYKEDVARRLLKLLMISRINKIPIFLLDRFKWELGLPSDYESVVIPEFPDYFRVVSEKRFGEGGKMLELVCWIDEFAVSEVEKEGGKDGKNQFCLQHSKDFEMDKKYKKWVDEWQKLPYVSPYENAMHLAAKTDKSDKWAVSVLHELLNLFVGKKAERDSLLYLGEHLGLRSRFKIAFLQHPGIFYVSSKIGTHTVVLKEEYKRGMLVERHPLMDMRFKYVQLMNVVTGEGKLKSTEKKKGKEKKRSEGKEPEDGEEDNDEIYGSSDDDDDESDEDDDESDEDESDDDESNDEVESEGSNVDKKGRVRRKGEDFVEKGLRNVARKTNYEKGFDGENGSKRGRIRREGENFEANDSRRNVGRRRTNGRNNYEKGFEGENTTSGGRFNRKDADFEENNSRRNMARSSNRRPSNDGGFEGGDMRKKGRFSKKGEDFEENGSSRNVTRRTNGRRDDRGNYGKGFEVENARKGRGFKRGGENFEENNSRRDVTRRTNGRPSNDGYDKGFEGENATKGGRFKSRSEDFEEKDSGRNVSRRRTNGRGSEENAYKSSSRFSKRTNVRSGDLNTPRLRTQKPDFPGKKADI